MKLAATVGQFDRLAKRERLLIVAACICAVLGAAQMLVIDPALNKIKGLNARCEEYRAQLQSFKGTRVDLERQLQRDVNAEIKSALMDAKRELAELDNRIKGFHQTLIPAQSMAKVMAGLLERQSGVQLISLRNIAPEPLTLSGSENKRASDPARKAQEPGKPLLYKHGMELVVEGGYFELLKYLEHIEHQPWRVIWADTALTSEYPTSRIRLKLYTLSMDPAWLSV